MLTVVLLAFTAGMAFSCYAHDNVADNDTLSTSKRYQRHAVTLPKKKQPAGTLIVSPAGDTIMVANADSILGLDGFEVIKPESDTTLGKVRTFNPDPTRALWLSALCPGLGQVYNRRYWKLPIVVGAFVGLAYGTSWNNRMLNDYTRAYRDAMDNDPDTRSYMNLYPPTTKESDLDMDWLKRALKNKKNYYRRYRDICIIGIVGVYALCMIDAYVDASLAHFDISPDLTLEVKPAVMSTDTGFNQSASWGLRCAFNF